MKSWPDFIIAGASKSGTSSLVALLAQHPRIRFSAVKEPSYFLGQGGGFCLSGPGDEGRLSGRTVERAAYQTLFRNLPDGVFGEASSNYFYDPLAAKAILRELPNARIIVILRNPIERAYSAYRHLSADGDETLVPFSAGLAAEAERTKGGFDYLWRYAECGYYGRYLRDWFALFPEGRLTVCYFEDLVSTPNVLGRRLCQFLGLELPGMDFIPVHENASQRRGECRLRDRMSVRLPGLLWRRWVPIRWRLRFRVSGMSDWRAVSVPADAARLLQEQYREDEKLLKALLEDNGFASPPWLK